PAPATCHPLPPPVTRYRRLSHATAAYHPPLVLGHPPSAICFPICYLLFAISPPPPLCPPPSKKSPAPSSLLGVSSRPACSATSNASAPAKARRRAGNGTWHCS